MIITASEVVSVRLGQVWQASSPAMINLWTDPSLDDEQVTQIGVMKAIGAGTGRILLIYFSGVLIYGVLALLIAIPLGVLGSQQFSNFLLYFFNIDSGPFALSSTAVWVQVTIALLAPLLAALVPIIAGARITVREAISTYGLGGGVGWLERTLARVRRLSRLILLTLNNTFRNRGRVIITQLALVGSGLSISTPPCLPSSTKF